jgi:hypothetical protein
VSTNPADPSNGLNGVIRGSSSGQISAELGDMFSAFLAGATAVHVSSKAGQAQLRT